MIQTNVQHPAMEKINTRVFFPKREYNSQNKTIFGVCHEYISL